MWSDGVLVIVAFKAALRPSAAERPEKLEELFEEVAREVGSVSMTMCMPM